MPHGEPKWVQCAAERSEPKATRFARMRRELDNGRGAVQQVRRGYGAVRFVPRRRRFSPLASVSRVPLRGS